MNDQPYCGLCGCTEAQACPGGCGWADAEKTICSTCALLMSRMREILEDHALRAASFRPMTILNQIESVMDVVTSGLCIASIERAREELNRRIIQPV